MWDDAVRGWYFSWNSRHSIDSFIFGGLELASTGYSFKLCIIFKVVLLFFRDLTTQFQLGSFNGHWGWNSRCWRAQLIGWSFLLWQNKDVSCCFCLSLASTLMSDVEADTWSNRYIVTSSKKETFLPLSRSLSIGSLGDFNRLLRPIRLSTSVSVTTITLRRLSSSCSSSSSSSGSLPGDRARRLPIRLPIAPSPKPFPVGGRVSASGGRARDRRASFALIDGRKEDISWP